MLHQTTDLDHVLTHLTLRLKVTEHEAHTRRCGPLHHGPGVQTMAVHLQHGHLLP